MFLSEKKVKELIQSSVSANKFKRKQRVYVFSKTLTESRAKYESGELCTITQVDGEGAELQVKPITDSNTDRQAWVMSSSCIREGLFNAIKDAFASSILRVDLLPFGKKGDKVKVNSNGFINVNNELFLELNEFSNLI